MTTLNKTPSESSDWASCIKELADLKEAFIEADYQSVLQRTQLKNGILESDEGCLYIYDQLEEAKAEIKRLKAKRRSGSQSKKKVLAEVRQPQSNTTSCAPHFLNVTNKEYDTKYRLAEEKHKSFDGNPSGDLLVDQDLNI